MTLGADIFAGGGDQLPDLCLLATGAAQRFLGAVCSREREAQSRCVQRCIVRVHQQETRATQGDLLGQDVAVIDVQAIAKGHVLLAARCGARSDAYQSFTRGLCYAH